MLKASVPKIKTHMHKKQKQKWAIPGFVHCSVALPLRITEANEALNGDRWVQNTETNKTICSQCAHTK